MSKETEKRARRVVKAMQPTTDIAGSEMILPNTSGDHVRSIKRAAPSGDVDLVNKKFVDDKFPVTHASTTGQTTDNHHAQAHAASHEVGGADLLTVENIQTSLTAGSVVFSDGSNLAQDNAKLFWDDANNRLGIGTNTPGSALSVNGNIVVNAGGVLGDANHLYFTGYRGRVGYDGTRTSTYLYGGTSKHIVFDTNGANERMRITSAGNVGIGTATPSAKLDVYGSNTLPMYVRTSDATGAYIRFLTGGTIPRGGIGYSTTGFHVLNAALDTIRLTVLDGGNVGIGTTTPVGALDVTSTTGGFIVPRMTTAQVAALTPVNGMIVYDLTLNKFQFYENGAWVSGSGLV